MARVWHGAGNDKGPAWKGNPPGPALSSVPPGRIRTCDTCFWREAGGLGRCPGLSMPGDNRSNSTARLRSPVDRGSPPYLARQWHEPQLMTASHDGGPTGLGRSEIAFGRERRPSQVALATSSVRNRCLPRVPRRTRSAYSPRLTEISSLPIGLCTTATSAATSICSHLHRSPLGDRDAATCTRSYPGVFSAGSWR